MSTSRIIANIVLAAALATLAGFTAGRQIEASIINEAVVGLEFVGATSPGVSATDRARLYYDTTADTIQMSLNGGAFAPLAGGSFLPLAGGTMVGNIAVPVGFVLGDATFAGEYVYMDTSYIEIASRTGAGDTYISVDGVPNRVEFGINGVVRWRFPDSGHLTSTATASADAGTGTCTAVTVAGNDVRGLITMTCTAAQTVIMNFGTAYAAAPACVASAANAAGATTVISAATATGTLTLTSIGVTTAGQYRYLCVE